MSELFGRDLRGVADSDSLFSEAVGLEVVRQDAVHRLTTDSILGDDGTGSEVIEDWGFDVRRLLGGSDLDLPAYQPLLVAVLLRDPRIETADVELTQDGTDVQIAVRCVTAEGPFDIVSSVADLTRLGVAP